MVQSCNARPTDPNLCLKLIGSRIGRGSIRKKGRLEASEKFLQLYKKIKL